MASIFGQKLVKGLILLLLHIFLKALELTEEYLKLTLTSKPALWYCLGLKSE